MEVMKRGRGRPKKPGGPMSDRARAEAYRMRLRLRGGARPTLNPSGSDLVRKALRYALEQQSWSEDDRVTLEHVRSVLRPPV